MGLFPALVFAIAFAALQPGDSVLVERSDGSTVEGSVDTVTPEELTLRLDDEQTVVLAWATVSQCHRLAAAPSSIRFGAGPRRQDLVLLATGATFLSYGTLLVASASRPPLPFLATAFLVAAPSAGHLYVGEYGRAFVTIGLRAAATGVLAASGRAFAMSQDCVVTSSAAGGGFDGCRSPPSWAVPGILLGVVAILGLTVYDIADAGRPAARTDTFSVLPTPIVADRRVVPGAALAVRF